MRNGVQGSGFREPLFIVLNPGSGQPDEGERRRPSGRHSAKQAARINRSSRSTAPWLRLFHRLGKGLDAADYLALHTIAGAIAAFASLYVFFEVADEIQLDEDMGRFDAALMPALRESLTPGMLQLFALFTRLGDVVVLVTLGLAVTAILLARREPLLASGWAIALAGNALLNRALKAVFQRERPLHDHGLVLETGWSFPSGHSSGSLVAYGMLAYLLLRVSPLTWRLPILLAAAMLVLLTGASRVFLQVHYPSDVLAGYASGATWLVICIAGTQIALEHRDRRQPAQYG